MISPWKALGVLKAAILTAAVLVSVRRRDAILVALFAAGFLAVNAAGLRWGLEAGRRSGVGRPMAAALTILLGSAWWAPIIAQGRAPRAGEEKADGPDAGPRR